MKKAGITKHVRPDSVQFLPDEQILALYDSRLSTKQKLAQAEYDFFIAISKCLTAKQVDEYFQLDRKFKRSAAKHQGNHECKHGDHHPITLIQIRILICRNPSVLALPVPSK